MKDRFKTNGIESRIIRGSCDEHFPSIPSQSVDLVLTDPPYKDYQSNRPVVHPKQAPIKKSGFNIPLFAEECHRVLKPGRHLYCFCCWKTYPLILNEIQKHFAVRALLVWVKNNHGHGDLYSYAPQYEFILFATKEGKISFTSRTGKPVTRRFRPIIPRSPDVLFKRRVRQKGGKGSVRLDGWWMDFYRKVGNIKFGHGATKPVDLLESLILKSTDPGDLVLDPYAGTMSTAEACINTGRRFLMIEIDSKCFDNGKERIKGLGTGLDLFTPLE